VLQAMPHFAASQVAVPLLAGAGQGVHEVPQPFKLELERQTPEQSWLPSGHIPVHDALSAMQTPAHGRCPTGHFGAHCPATQSTLPPLGALHGSHVEPQLSTTVSLAQRFPQRCIA
jgi:hypothetical protein